MFRKVPGREGCSKDRERSPGQRRRTDFTVQFAFALASASAIPAICPSSAKAHGPIDAQIARVTRLLEQAPHDAELYLKRGELHRVHGDFEAALLDYDRARKEAPDLFVLDLVRGQTLLEAGRPAEANKHLDRFLETSPGHVDARVCRAEARVLLGERLSAVEDYTRALEVDSVKAIEIYVARARALEAEGPQYYERALAGLDEGIERFGSLLLLLLPAIDLELACGRIERALERIDRVEAESARKEKWWLKKARILHAAGRAGEARELVQAALAAIDNLPHSRRQATATLKMAQEARELLAQLDSSDRR